IMQGRILIHELEMVRMFLSISKLRRPETTNREFMEAKHICHRHKAKSCPIQLRTLGNTCPDKQSTITATHDCQPLRSSIPLINQPFSRSDKIIKHILFLIQNTIQMPGLTEFAAPA